MVVLLKCLKACLLYLAETGSSIFNGRRYITSRLVDLMGDQCKREEPDLHCQIQDNCQIIRYAPVKETLLVERSYVVLAHMIVLKYREMICANCPTRTKAW